MTLTSHFRTDAPINPRRVHDFVTALVNPSGMTAIVDHEPGKYMNVPGQGFEAWVWTRFGQDGPIDDSGDYDEYVPEDWDSFEDYEDFWGISGRDKKPVATIDVGMDSPYGYRDELNRTCTTFHADLFFSLHNFVMSEYPEANTYWYNEYAGTWHGFGDEDGWFRFIGDGTNAHDWFIREVSPFLHRNGLTTRERCGKVNP